MTLAQINQQIVDEIKNNADIIGIPADNISIGKLNEIIDLLPSIRVFCYPISKVYENIKSRKGKCNIAIWASESLDIDSAFIYANQVLERIEKYFIEKSSLQIIPGDIVVSDVYDDKAILNYDFDFMYDTSEFLSND